MYVKDKLKKKKEREKKGTVLKHKTKHLLRNFGNALGSE